MPGNSAYSAKRNPASLSGIGWPIERCTSWLAVHTNKLEAVFRSSVVEAAFVFRSFPADERESVSVFCVVVTYVCVAFLRSLRSFCCLLDLVHYQLDCYVSDLLRFREADISWRQGILSVPPRFHIVFWSFATG